MEPGNDPRLKRLLHEWRVPDAPDTLEKRCSVGRTVVAISDGLARSRPVAGRRCFLRGLVWLAVLAVRDDRPAVEPLSTSYDLRGFQPVKSVHVRIERSSDATR
jgi:hypothetical protein